MYKAALIGLGRIAWKMGRDLSSGSSLCHKDAFDINKKTKLVGGFSPMKSDIVDFSESTGVEGFIDLNKMLKELKPDIVSICSPDSNHSEHLELCINFKVPMIWLEKPATISESETFRLEQVRCKKAPKSTVLVNFQRRYTETYIRLRDTINKEAFGKCLSVNINYSRGLSVNGSHMMDLIHFLFPSKLFDLLWVEKGVNLKNPSFVLSSSEDILIQVSGSNSDFHNIDISITFENARISIIHGGLTTRFEKVRENELFPNFSRLYDEKINPIGSGGFNYAFDKALENLIKSFETSSEPISNLKTSIYGQSLVEKVLKESAKA